MKSSILDLDEASTEPPRNAFRNLSFGDIQQIRWLVNFPDEKQARPQYSVSLVSILKSSPNPNALAGKETSKANPKRIDFIGAPLMEMGGLVIPPGPGCQPERFLESVKQV